MFFGDSDGLLQTTILCLQPSVLKHT